MFHKVTTYFSVTAIILLFYGCGSIDPRNMEVTVQESMPTKKVTSFDKVLSDLGRMSTIYGNGVRIQSEYIADNTGSYIDTKTGIPKDITEMTKSSLNAIGGEIVYIPYNPKYLNNAMLTGYSGFENKLLPDVILSGGITEFDQNIETRSKNFDAAVTTQPFNVDESWVPDTAIEAGYNDSEKSELARITLDFNLVDFVTFSGIAKVQTVNTVIVEKVVADKELAFSLFGPTFGLSGSVTKAQGQHATIRLLVQLSVAQIVGKYLMLPYWKLLPDAEPDQYVIDRILKAHSKMSNKAKIRVAQVSLFFKGHNVAISGKLDAKTVDALRSYDQNFNPSSNTINSDLHLKLWDSISDDISYTLTRQAKLSKIMRAQKQAVVSIKAQEQVQKELKKKEKPAPDAPPEVSVNSKPEMSTTTTTDSSSKVPDAEKQKALREKASQDAVFRLLKKLSIWDDEKK